MNQVKTKETIEYEKALKNLHELSLKKAMSEEGIDTSKIPRKKFDEIRRLVDQQNPVRQKYQEIINKAQQDATAAITRAQQDMQAELKEIQNQIEEIVKQVKIEQGIIQEEKPPEAGAQPEGAGIEAGAGKEPEVEAKTEAE